MYTSLARKIAREAYHLIKKGKELVLGEATDAETEVVVAVVRVEVVAGS